MSEQPYSFKFTSPINDIEYIPDRDSVYASGVILRLDIPTKNGRIYRVSEAEQMINEVIGTPVFIGQTRGEHNRSDDNYVGKVREVQNIDGVLVGKVEIWNTPRYPRLIERVKRGWGFSLGGRVKDMIQIKGKITKDLRPVYSMKGMMSNHIQLLEPRTRRGDPTAMVRDIIPVGESFMVGEGEQIDIVTKEEFEKAMDEMKEIVQESVAKLTELDKQLKKQLEEEANAEPKVIEKEVVKYVQKPKKVNITVVGLGEGDEVKTKEN
jgi:hypothetical protein